MAYQIKPYSPEYNILNMLVKIETNKTNTDLVKTPSVKECYSTTTSAYNLTEMKKLFLARELTPSLGASEFDDALAALKINGLVSASGVPTAAGIKKMEEVLVELAKRKIELGIDTQTRIPTAEQLSALKQPI